MTNKDFETMTNKDFESEILELENITDEIFSAILNLLDGIGYILLAITIILLIYSFYTKKVHKYFPLMSLSSVICFLSEIVLSFVCKYDPRVSNSKPFMFPVTLFLLILSVFSLKLSFNERNKKKK